MSIRPAFLAVTPQDTVIMANGVDDSVTVMDCQA